MKNSNSVANLKHVSLGNYVTFGRKFQDNSLVLIPGINVKTSIAVDVFKKMQMWIWLRKAFYSAFERSNSIFNSLSGFVFRAQFILRYVGYIKPGGFLSDWVDFASFSIDDKIELTRKTIETLMI